MATSGSIDYNLTRSNIIKRALQILGVVGATEIVSSEDDDLATDMLNMMVKDWQAKNIHIWSLSEATLYLTKGTESYTFNGADASDSVVETTLGADEASSQTEITVTSSTGMTANDVVLIELDDGTLHSTTISSVDDATTITIASGLASAASSGAEVFTYTTKINRPFEITQCRRRDQDDNDYIMTHLSRDDYYNISDKDTESKPIHWFYDRQRDNGTLYLWPAPDSIKDRIKITYKRTIEDFDAGTDNPDLPHEWLLTLTYNLAANLAPAYGKDQKGQLLQVRADQMLADMMDWDNDHTDASMTPDIE